MDSSQSTEKELHCERFLTASEIAELLPFKCSRQSVYNYMSAGKRGVVLHSENRRSRVSDVIRFLDELSSQEEETPSLIGLEILRRKHEVL